MVTVPLLIEELGIGRVDLDARSTVLAQIQMNIESRNSAIKFVVSVLLFWVR